ncbi:acyltransferase family protein [Sphingomonas sp. Root710]|uniref:acyltransferase family protein n=1 Tax=Sphingomonas sp. Root710 TaxID=1736594 RepID=UPI000A3F36EB|nr:acyltransferase family protein [Sphingomonas sp. Root710]
MIRYRKDIEGLRALAVLSIILFHFGESTFAGGYVGVDIFYVISGFLIGKSVIAGVTEGRFSLRDFLVRRLRRLYPAQVAMFAVCTPAAMILLLPEHLVAYARSLAAAALYASNMQFLREAGYFDSWAFTKPLLHTWSLGVEAQFYVAFPLLILLLSRLGGGRKLMIGIVAALGLLSLVAAEAVLRTSPVAAFYLFPLRAWELFVGVVIGVVEAPYRLLTRRWLREAMTAVGLSLIIAPMFLFGSKTAFPGLHAIPPVLGAALIIGAGSAGHSLIGDILSRQPFTGVGLISYSLYLWHWPIIVFLTYYAAGDLPGSWRLAGLAMTLMAALLSYHFVERPFRKRRSSDARTVAWALVLCLIFVVAGAGLRLSHGFPQRYGREQQVLANAASDFWQRRGECFGQDNQRLAGVAYCRLGDPAAKPDFLIWGDSHARAFRDGIDLAAREAGRSGLLVTEAGCPPLIGVRKVASAQSRVEDDACFTNNVRLMLALGQDHALRDVVLIGRWAFYATGHGIGSDSDNAVRLTWADRRDGPPAELFEFGLTRSVEMLRGQGRRVFILEQLPEFADFSAYRLAVRVILRGEATDAAIGAIGLADRPAVERRQAAAQRTLAKLAANGDAIILPSHGRFCGPARCSAVQDGHPLLFDHDHVTVDGSYRLRGLFDPMLKGEAR